MKMARKIVAVLLTLVLLCSCVSALAEVPKISNGVIKYPEETWSSQIGHSNAKRLIIFNLNTNAAIKASIYEKATGALYTGVADSEEPAGNVTLWWNGVNTVGWHPDAGHSIDLILKINAANAEGNAEAVYPFTFYSGHNMASHTEEVLPPIEYDPLDPEQEPKPKPIKPTWYDENTVCSFGPHFRNISPELTDKWYMFTALDLSQDGVQTYEMVAGGMYKVGYVTITVEGDNVTVDYAYVNPAIYDHGEFFTLFGDYDEITTVNPAEIESAFEYGKTISIANDLGGDTQVLLFTRNLVTFRKDNADIERFYENIPWRKELRESMLDAIGKTYVK